MSELIASLWFASIIATFIITHQCTSRAYQAQFESQEELISTLYKAVQRAQEARHG